MEPTVPYRYLELQDLFSEKSFIDIIIICNLLLYYLLSKNSIIIMIIMLTLLIFYSQTVSNGLGRNARCSLLYWFLELVIY